MKAIVYDEYGSPDVLQFRDIEIPAVGDDEVLIDVHAASPNPWDWHFMRGEPYLVRLTSGRRKPRPDSVLGSDVAGRVAAVGQDVTRFRPGDEVFGFVGSGAFADHVSVPEKTLALKPANTTFEQAAAVPLAALTALVALRDHGRLEPGHRVIVNGASGGVGTFAVQIAKALGAEVTAVCSTKNVEMVRSIGADQVIDYTKENPTETGDRYDLVLDNVGNHRLAEWRRIMRPNGVFVAVAGREPMTLWLGPVAHWVKVLLASLIGSQRFTAFLVKVKHDDLDYLRELIEGGKVSPVIDRTFALSAAPEAIRLLEEGHVRGKVVITG
jgi:NADPH:quinone reductase-like Zn-dependent oxidoreductase